MANGKKEKGRAEQQRQRVGGVNSRKTRLPEPPGTHYGAGIGIDQDKSGKHKKQIHPNVAYGRKVFVPPGTGGEKSFDSHMKHDDVESGKKAQRSERL